MSCIHCVSILTTITITLCFMKMTNFILLVLAVVLASSCKSVERSKKFVNNLNTARDKVYTQVRLVKNSTTLSQDQKDKLKAQYEGVAKGFNDEYDAIIKRLPDE